MQYEYVCATLRYVEADLDILRRKLHDFERADAVQRAQLLEILRKLGQQVKSLADEALHIGDSQNSAHPGPKAACKPRS